MVYFGLFGAQCSGTQNLCASTFVDERVCASETGQIGKVLVKLEEQAKSQEQEPADSAFKGP